MFTFVFGFSYSDLYLFRFNYYLFFVCICFYIFLFWCAFFVSSSHLQSLHSSFFSSELTGGTSTNWQDIHLVWLLHCFIDSYQAVFVLYVWFVLYYFFVLLLLILFLCSLCSYPSMWTIEIHLLRHKRCFFVFRHKEEWKWKTIRLYLLCGELSFLTFLAFLSFCFLSYCALVSFLSSFFCLFICLFSSSQLVFALYHLLCTWFVTHFVFLVAFLSTLAPQLSISSLWVGFCFEW